MFLKQKRVYLHIHRLRLVLAFLVFAFFSFTTAVLSPPANTYAIGECPGEERQGTGTAPLTDTNKCYLNNQATSNVPTGSADEGTDTDDTSGASTTEDEGTTCAVENIGWILCPVIKAAATMSDKIFQFLADNFLEVEPELLTSKPTGKGTIDAWEQARNLANIAFVIAFILIIYSQITGAGLNNYGIKRMLPRLIIAAIAVNVSYYICQAMVDISNLLGYNIMTALQNISNEIGPSVMGGSNQGTNTETGDGWLAKIAIGALAVAGLVWLILGPLASVVALILVTCMVIVIILLLRKAFIVLLVVVSPLAFVAYLLPNTEKYFSKWLNMFWQLLMVFPVVALLLGGGQLASTIILVSGSEDPPAAGQEVACGNESVNDNTADADPNAPATEPVAADDASRINRDSYGISGECGEDITMPNGTKKQAGWTLGLVAAGVAVAPLLAVWAVLKGALSAAGAIGGKISGAVQKGSGGVGGLAGKGLGAGEKALKKRMGESTQAAWQRSQARGIAGDPEQTGRFDRAAGAYARRKAKRGAILGASKDELSRGMSSYANSSDIQGNLSGLTEAGQKRALARAAAAETKERGEEVQGVMAQLNNDDNPIKAAQERLEESIKSGDKIGARGAQNVLMSSGGAGMDGFVQTMARAEAAGNEELINALKQNALQNHGGTMKEKAGVAQQWATGTASMATARSGAAGNAFAGLNDEQIAKQTSTSLNAGLRNGWLTREAATRITTGSVGENLGQGQRAVLEDYAKNGNVPPPPPTP